MEMEFNEIQILVTAIFLVSALVVVVLCNRTRGKKKRRRGGEVFRPDQIWQGFAPSSDPVSLAPEIAALAKAGMGEENTVWQSVDQPSEPSVASVKAGAEPANGSQLPPPTIDGLLFDRLVSGQSAENPAGEVVAEGEHIAPPPPEIVIDAIQRPYEIARPSGLIDEPTLRRVLAIGKPFTGVAVSVSMNGEENEPCSESQVEWVGSYVGSLLQNNDFACRIGKQEFLIVCPGVRGAEAQRRWTDISEGLWAFQLRGIGAYSIQFSWGGVHAQNQPLRDAIASAVERMRQSRRGRNPIHVDPVNARRQVV